MSLKALTWAFEQEVVNPLHKFVLVAMADFASDTGKTYPSMITVCRMTSLKKRDTVAKAIAKLVESGFLYETGEKAGETGKIAVYQMPDGACKLIPEIARPGDSIARPAGNSIARELPANSPRIARLAESPNKEEPGNHEPVHKERNKRVPFSKPTIEEVMAFCSEVGLPPTDGEAFFWNKEANGWMNGKSAVKDWKATIRNWKANGWMKSQKSWGPSERPPKTSAAPPQTDYSKGF